MNELWKWTDSLVEAESNFEQRLLDTTEVEIIPIEPAEQPSFVRFFDAAEDELGVLDIDPEGLFIKFNSAVPAAWKVTAMEESARHMAELCANYLKNVGCSAFLSYHDTVIYEWKWVRWHGANAIDADFKNGYTAMFDTDTHYFLDAVTNKLLRHIKEVRNGKVPNL